MDLSDLELGEEIRDALKKPVINYLEEAFTAFGNGSWQLRRYRGDGRICWEMEDDGFWGGQAPVRIEISPETFTEAVLKSIEYISENGPSADQIDVEDRDNMLVVFAKWRAAIDACEVALGKFDTYEPTQA